MVFAEVVAAVGVAHAYYWDNSLGAHCVVDYNASEVAVAFVDVEAAHCIQGMDLVAAGA